MDLDYEFDDRECLKCGHSPTHSRSCLECHGEGGFDCYDDDPINFSPGEEFETCEVCHGSGIEWWCPECGTDLAEMQDAAMLDLNQLRICCNPDCGWTGPAAECVHPHHWPEDRLCPKCNEVTEALELTEDRPAGILECLATGRFKEALEGIAALQAEINAILAKD